MTTKIVVTTRFTVKSLFFWIFRRILYKPIRDIKIFTR